MNRRVTFLAIWCVAISLASTFWPQISSAQLFRRGGCSTGYCATPAYHAPAVKQRDFIQQIFFAAPAGYIAPVGEAQYGLARALDLIAPDPNAFLNNSNAHIAAASSSSLSARQVSSDVLAVEQTNAIERQIRAKSQGIVDAARALAGDFAVDQPRSLVLTMRNGVFESAREIKPDEPQAVPRSIGSGCAKCHGSESKNVDALSAFKLGPTLTLDEYTRAATAINEGVMPPESKLTVAERALEVLKLSRLVPVP